MSLPLITLVFRLSFPKCQNWQLNQTVSVWDSQQIAVAARIAGPWANMVLPNFWESKRRPLETRISMSRDETEALRGWKTSESWQKYE